MDTTSEPSARLVLLKIENIISEGDQVLLTGTFKIPRDRFQEVLALLAAPAAPASPTVEDIVRHKFQVLMPGSDWSNGRVRESATMLLQALNISATHYARLQGSDRIELLVKALSQQPASRLFGVVFNAHTLIDLAGALRRYSKRYLEGR